MQPWSTVSEVGHSHVVDADVGGDGTDEAHQLLIGDDPHTAVPLRQPARGAQGPETRPQLMKESYKDAHTPQQTRAPRQTPPATHALFSIHPAIFTFIN